MSLPNVQNDPAQYLSNDVFGQILAMSENLRAAARVSKEWNRISSRGYAHTLCNYDNNPLLRSFHLDEMVRSDLPSKEIVLRTVGRLQKQLRMIDQRAADVLNNKSYPITAISLENLVADACLSRFFDQVFVQIPANLRPRLPENFHDRISFIRTWMNNPANQAALNAITDLSLYNCSLLKLPPEIGRLGNLTQLNLSHNQLTDMPPEIGRLGHLQALHLVDNRFTAAPPEIIRLGNLEWLNLSNNRLTTVPPEIGRLGNLTKLYLSGNKLTAVPPEIGRLGNLERLDLDNNQLTAVPPEIGNLGNLEELHLDNNKLTPDARDFLLNLQQQSVHHLWIGYDHLSNPWRLICNFTSAVAIAALGVSAYALLRYSPW